MPVLVLLWLDSLVASWFAAALFLLAALSDALDGWLARRYDLETPLGRLLDPIADKILISALLIWLVFEQRASPWAVILIHVREFAVSALRQAAATRGVVIAAAPAGKIKTVLQHFAVLLMIPLAPWYLLVSAQVVLWLATVVTVFSGLSYFLRHRQLLRLSVKG